LAHRNSYEYIVEGETFTFGLPGVEKKEKFVLKLGRDLLEFTPKLDIAQQVSEVRVVGWNSEFKKEIIEYANEEDIKDVDRDGKTGAQTIQSVCKEEVVKEVRTSVQNNEEAKLLAKSILSYSIVQAQCRAIGIPELRPGQVIRIEGVGDLFPRKYYVDKVIHKLGGNESYAFFPRSEIEK
jgi:phage protein D